MSSMDMNHMTEGMWERLKIIIQQIDEPRNVTDSLSE